ncbi:FAD-dependent monooxygenase [Actinocrispum sp. NPDC049592]|uniref:FAD-dependent monooxygenase n=1 Tax=Actinocrispum sp. NPDC049592 TaxID=3154835 RepID=UPI00343A23AD
MVNRTVLISGAGIGGPALAFWLRRHGFAPTVVEVAPAPRPGGHAVDLRGAGREVVSRMGLLDAVRAERVDERGFAYVDGRGRWSARMPASLFEGEGLVAEIEIMRGNLTRILYEATRDGTEYLFSSRITGLAEDGDGVKVTFADGGARRFDLVVGADGLHSGVRRLAFGPSTEFVRHLGGYMAYFTVPDPGSLDHWFLMHCAPGGLVAGIRPENGGTAKAMLSFTSPSLDCSRHDVAAQQEILRARFAGVGWLVPEVLAAMPGAEDFYFDSLSQVHMGQWYRGRTVLLGDAGYCGSPLAGLGTAVALVAAYVLAGELAAAPDDHLAAFARYQDAMLAYVKQCQALPPGGMKGFAPSSALMIHLRNLSMTVMTRWPMRALTARHFHKADAITLKDY